MADFGLTPAGFKPMALADTRSDLQAAIRQAFGDNANLDSRSVWGNFVDIFAERFALLWQLSQSIYDSSNPNAASGLAVDNILALNNLTRIGATPTRTAQAPVIQANGITLYGLVLFGDPGTVIPAGALISDGLAAPTTFSLDGPVTIQPGTNARQTLTFSNAPTTGSYALTLTDPLGNQLTTPTLTYGQSPQSVQAAISALARPSDELQPFTDVVVSTFGTGYQFDFGAGSVAESQPPSGQAAIGLITVASNTLQQAQAVTNISILESRVGAPAQGVGSATATTTGPNVELAGALTTIVTPQSGWSGVTNQLDAEPGTNVETDAEALARMQSLRASQGSASLSAIVERVKQISGVTACIAFENKTSAALQRIVCSKAPTTGQVSFSVAEGQTKSLSAPLSAGAIQSALNAVTSYEALIVTGDAVNGFAVDFNGSQGGQAQPLLQVVNNTTDATISAAFGRPAHSVEVVADGGTTQDVTSAILAALPAGIAAWGAPALQTLGSIMQGSASLTVASAVGAEPGLIATMPSLPLGTQIASVSGNTLTTNQVGQSTVSNANLVLQNGALLTDSQSNVHLVTFTRPQKTLIFVSVQLVTDAHVTPGNASSAINASAKWSAASVPTIQQAIASVINQAPIGGLIVMSGTNGVFSSFRDVPGVVSASVQVDTVNPPVNSGNLALQPAQSAVCELANVAVSFV